MTRALVTTTPARAYTICHPDGRLVAEACFPSPTEPGLFRRHYPTGIRSEWHSASDYRLPVQRLIALFASERWGLDVPELVDATPADPTADIIASLETERDRLRALVEDLGAQLAKDQRPLTPGAVQAARMLERERIVAWLRKASEASRESGEPGVCWVRLADEADAIERGEHEEDEGNG